MTLEIVDGIGWVKERPEQFLRSGKIDPVQLLAFVMADVVGLGSGDCRICSRGDWWFVSSNVDWLSHRDLNVGDLFARVVPAPGHGEHAMRAEVLLSAFSADVVTGTSKVDLIVKGKKPIARLVQRAVDRSWSRRFVAFRVAQ